MNLFRNLGMRQTYDACIDAGRRHLWIASDGSQRRGSSHAGQFWNGYNGTKAAYGNPDDIEFRRTLGYAAWRAGQDFADEKGQ